jgi:rhamnulose-1-phosphate aldolase/alcohol dehydrogenase
MKSKELKYLKDHWDHEFCAKLDDPERLRYRSNLLGTDLRITNFGGGNTSSKIMMLDPLAEKEVEILWVKGSGGDLGSIKRDGFATLYIDKFLSLHKKYRGKKYEDKMLEFYPLCTFGLNTRPASIDTPLHGLIPLKNIDHMHPDWAIGIAASANGRQLLKDFNSEFGYNLIWIPWQRPGYELGLMIKSAIASNPEAEGALLGSHGLINWADGHYDCYRRTIEIIDSMGQFVFSYLKKKSSKVFGGKKFETLPNKNQVAESVFPILRGNIGKDKNVIGNYVDSEEVLDFINSNDAAKLSFMGTSCPDHFIRTKVRPLFINWHPQVTNHTLQEETLKVAFDEYQIDYEKYYNENKDQNSPGIRGTKPSIVLIPGVGMFSFGKTKKEARITSEFYINAIHVMQGATSMETGKIDDDIDPSRVFNNYVSLPAKEAFNIEYWVLEEAKIQRQPKEKEMSGKIAFVSGGGSGIGREFCLKLAREGAHVIVGDIDVNAARETTRLVDSQSGSDVCIFGQIDITNRDSIRNAFSRAVIEFGGIDILINTAAVFIHADRSSTKYYDDTWNKIFNINITGNNILVEEFFEVINKQGSYGTVLLTSSANAVVPKYGSEPYDVSKAAINHLIRELAVRYSPKLRINGVSPATVIEGSSMFSRERIISSLEKYKINFSSEEKTKDLRYKLADYYAQRTLLQKDVRPIDIVEAGYFLISQKSDRTTGTIIPVDSGLRDAFLR